MEWSLMYIPPVSMSRPNLIIPFENKMSFFISSSTAKKRSLLIFEIQFPMLLFLRLFKTTRKWKVVTKNKMDNPMFVDEETIPMVHQDEDYDDYNTPNASRIDETSFTEPDTTEATSTLQLRQKVKQDKITALYGHLNVTADPGLADIDRFMIKKKNSKTGNTDMLFLDGNNYWKSLTNKPTGDFLAAKTLREKFGGLNIMKSVLSLDETPSALERSFKAATKLNRELPMDLEIESIPLEELSCLVEDIHVKTREASQNTDLDMREFLGIDKALQSIQGEFLNNASKLAEIDKRIKRDTKKLQEVENDPTYSDEQRQLYRDRLDDLNTEKQARLEILSQNRKDLQTQVARIKQTLEKVLDKNTSLAERIRTLFREQGITIFSILTALSMTISTIVLAITGAFGGGGGTGGSLPKDEGWLGRLADALKRLAGKAVEALPAIAGSVVSAILSFLGKAVGFVAEHTWALIVFAAGLIGVWLIQRIKID